MTSMDSKIKAIHSELLTEINDTVVQDADSAEYQNLRQMFLSLDGIKKGTLSKCKNLLEILQLTGTRGHLAPGNYRQLRTMMSESGNQDVVNLIDDADHKIKEIKESDPSCSNVMTETDKTVLEDPDVGEEVTNIVDLSMERPSKHIMDDQSVINYIRLLQCLCNDTANVLRELFAECAKKDVGGTYTALEAYILQKKYDNIRLIPRDWFQVVFTHDGRIDIETWNVSDLITMLRKLFPFQLRSHMHDLHTIRGIRNSLTHLSKISVSDEQFNEMWSRIKISTLSLAKFAKGPIYCTDIETSMTNLLTKTNWSSDRDISSHWNMFTHQIIEKDVAINVIRKKLDQLSHLVQGDNAISKEVSMMVEGVSKLVEDMCEDMQMDDSRSETSVVGGLPWTGSSLVLDEDIPLLSWKECILNKDEQSSRDLLRTHKLPSSSELPLLCETFGQKSVIVEEICDKVCKMIKQQSENIVSVIPACRRRENSIVFCVTTKDSSKQIEYSNYAIIQRASDEHSSEEAEILNYELEKDLALTDEQDNEIGDCLDKYGPDLIRKHSNISVISPSILKSKGFATKKATVEEKPCIALFVHFKGMIPLGEDPFPSTVGDFDIDVREGHFHYRKGGRPGTKHGVIKMGCCIATERNGQQEYGTLGGFVDHREHGLCCLTCAHVMLDDKEMEQMRKDEDTWFNNNDVECYQPSSPDRIGMLKTAVISPGKKDVQAGVDAALVQITHRHPNSGKFPDPFTNEQSLELEFSSGKVGSEKSCGATTKVVKYGKSSGYTHGRCFTKKALTNCKIYMLHKQIGINRNHDAKYFSLEGDSGSIVFTKNSSGQIDAAVGLLIGGTADRDFASPVCSVLKQFELQSLKSFATNPTEQSPPHGAGEISLSENETQVSKKQPVVRPVEPFAENVVNLTNANQNLSHQEDHLKTENNGVKRTKRRRNDSGDCRGAQMKCKTLKTDIKDDQQEK